MIAPLRQRVRMTRSTPPQRGHIAPTEYLPCFRRIIAPRRRQDEMGILRDPRAPSLPLSSVSSSLTSRARSGSGSSSNCLASAFKPFSAPTAPLFAPPAVCGFSQVVVLLVVAETSSSLSSPIFGGTRSRVASQVVVWNCITEQVNQVPYDVVTFRRLLRRISRHHDTSRRISCGLSSSTAQPVSPALSKPVAYW